MPWKKNKIPESLLTWMSYFAFYFIVNLNLIKKTENQQFNDVQDFKISFLNVLSNYQPQ